MASRDEHAHAAGDALMDNPCSIMPDVPEGTNGNSNEFARFGWTDKLVAEHATAMRREESQAERHWRLEREMTPAQRIMRQQIRAAQGTMACMRISLEMSTASDIAALVEELRTMHHSLIGLLSIVNTRHGMHGAHVGLPYIQRGDVQHVRERMALVAQGATTGEHMRVMGVSDAA